MEESFPIPLNDDNNTKTTELADYSTLQEPTLEIEQVPCYHDNDDIDEAGEVLDPLLQQTHEYGQTRWTDQDPFDLDHKLQLSDFIGAQTDYSGVQLNSGNAVTRDDHILPQYNQLVKAIREGDWEDVRLFLEVDPDLKTARITGNGDTILHAAMCNEEDEGTLLFLKKLLEVMPPETLELQNEGDGQTACHIAAKTGYLETVKLMVKKNPNVTQIRDKKGRVPLLCAANLVSNQQKETVEFLCTVTGDEIFSSNYGARILCTIISAGFYDLALSLVQRFPELVIAKTETNPSVCALDVIAQCPYAFLSGSQLTSWQRFIYPYIPVNLAAQSHKGDIEDPPESLGDQTPRARSPMIKFLFLTYIAQVPCVKQVYDQKLMHEQSLALVTGMCAQLRSLAYSDVVEFFKKSSVMKAAIRYGTVELVEECLRSFPELVWFRMKKKTVLQIAVEERNEKIVNLIFCEMKLMNKMKVLVSKRDLERNTILHHAAKLASSPQLNSVSGAALQMQRELLWYKGVENMLPQNDKLSTNLAGNTAQVIFTEEHKDLVEKGEKWMKDTAQSCMLVAALIATVVFAAAFTVPGGNISDGNSSKNGSPIFLYENSFMVFAIADALALFSSITSILMFLSILTSRYAEQDFLKSLPNKLIIGLSTLFISIATMMVAFGAALSIVLGRRLAWVIVPVIVFSAVPVTLFAFLQFPLFLEMVYSTYFRRIIRYKS